MIWIMYWFIWLKRFLACAECNLRLLLYVQTWTQPRPKKICSGESPSSAVGCYAINHFPCFSLGCFVWWSINEQYHAQRRMAKPKALSRANGLGSATFNHHGVAMYVQLGGWIRRHIASIMGEVGIGQRHCRCDWLWTLSDKQHSQLH